MDAVTTLPADAGPHSAGVDECDQDRALDDLLQIAACLCDVPIILLTTEDPSRTRLRSSTPLTADAIERYRTLSAKAAAGSDSVFIADACIDDRWAGDPLVTSEPSVRFYGGLALIGPDGERLGAVSLIDHVPRILSPRQTEGLRALGRRLIRHLVRPSQQTVEEARYRELFMANPHPMWVYDLESLAFLAVNDTAVEHYGYSRDEFLAMTIKDIRPPEDVDRLLNNIAKVTEGLDRAGVWRHLKKDGSLCYVEITSHTLRFDGRRAELVLAHDVTERLQAEARLRESQERFRLVAEVTNDVLWDWNLITDDHWWSPNAREKFGYDPAKEPGIAAWRSRLHPEDRARVLRQVEACVKSGARMFFDEYRFLLADGSYGFFWDKGQVVYDAEGKPVRMIGAMIDITTAKRAYASLEQAYRRLQWLSRELQRAEEKERRRLSRELHDEFGQLLSALRLSSGACGKSWRNIPARRGRRSRKTSWPRPRRRTVCLFRSGGLCAACGLRCWTSSDWWSLCDRWRRIYDRERGWIAGCRLSRRTSIP